MYLVSTDWLIGNLSHVKIIDASWHLPSTNRDGFEEYKIEHIENSIFFDLDEFSEKNTDLPHMLSDAKTWSKNISKLGIENEDLSLIHI